MRRAWPLLLLAIPAAALIHSRSAGPAARVRPGAPDAIAHPVESARVPATRAALPPPEDVRWAEIEPEEEDEDSADAESLEALAVDRDGRPLADLPMQLWIDDRTYAATSDDAGRFRIPSPHPRRSARALACGTFPASARLHDGRLVFVFED